jgi:hypothetical protein
MVLIPNVGKKSALKLCIRKGLNSRCDANTNMARVIIKPFKPKTTSWGAGGQTLPGRKPSKASVIRYLKAIEKRDGVTRPRT